MPHVVLLGDSIFDNGRYVPGEPDVAEQLRAALPSEWKVSLVAVDGDVVAGVPGQLDRLPRDATHLAVSAGGNDALRASGVLDARVSSVAEAVGLLAEVQQRFAEGYAHMLEAVQALQLPTAVCTIYDTPTSTPDQTTIRAALAVFNDEITRAAFVRRLPLIDLRLICNENSDYANPIEPSAKGGAKIARAIGRWLVDDTTFSSWVVI